MNPTMIVKGSGETVPFDQARLRRSLERSGAAEPLIDAITDQVIRELKTGMTTKAIYRMAFSLLRRKSRASAARYKLKQAIIELGPTGYPFERYIGELLRQEGFGVRVSVILPGRCASHEVDVLAENETGQFIVECKFHSDQYRKCNIQVPLYIQARVNDLQQAVRQPEAVERHGWIFTNTRFTEDALHYGLCVGLQLVDWNHPPGHSLKERIDASNLHPLTCLSSLRKSEKQKLLEHGVVLCKQITGVPVLMEALIEPSRHRKILDEVAQFLG